MNYQKYFDEVFEEAKKEEYPMNDVKLACQLELLHHIHETDTSVLDFCNPDYSLIEAIQQKLPNAFVIAFNGHTEMHDWASSRPDLFRVIIVRHVLEHSISPYILLKQLMEMLTEGGRILAIVPEDNERMCYLSNHYSCFSRNGWEGLFDKCGLEFTFLGTGVFGSDADKTEWRYELKRKTKQ